MGREAAGTIHHQGHSGSGKILLESGEVILRGGLRSRIPRGEITAFRAEGEDLVIEHGLGTLRATLGAKEAAAWVKALAKPVPGLAAKLGMGPDRPVQALGTLTDPVLVAALEGSIVPGAAQMIAEIADAAALDHALTTLATAPAAAFWAVTIKGAASPFPEATLRARMRAAGFIDTKSCAVSETRSATRFHRR